MPIKLKTSTPRHGLLEAYSFATTRGATASEGEAAAQGFLVPPEAAGAVLAALRLALSNTNEHRNPPQPGLRGDWLRTVR